MKILRITFKCDASSVCQFSAQTSGAVGVHFKEGTNLWAARRPLAGALLIRPTPKWVTTMYDVITWRYGVI